MGGNHSRDKGARGERDAVKLMQKYGFAAEKISRMYGPNRDISFPFLGVDRMVEHKWRKDGFKQIYEHKGDNFALIIRADHKRPLVVIDLEDALSFAALAEKGMKL